MRLISAQNLRTN